jgi:acetylornithine deacetylase/succinyl-diaminopimelate desuccinylase family protein
VRATVSSRTPTPEPAHTGEAVALLQELVRAPSPNPPGDERRVAAVARAYLETCPGVVIEDVGISPERPLLVATLEGRAGGREIVFAGHLDTVPAGDGWTRDPFGGEVDDGRLYGRGAADMKGGIAGFLVAMRRLALEPDRWSGTIVSHLVPDEEPGGQLGTQILLERGRLHGDAAIVAEPSELRVFTAQKGNIFAAFTFRGRAAHGSMPEHGENAISAAARFVVALEDQLRPRLAEREHELVGHATVSVGTVKGGRRTNVVPDECVVTVDRRLLPGESVDAALGELTALADGRAELTLEHIGAAFETAADHWLVQAARKAVASVRGAQSIGGLVGSSDARFYAGAGLPTILLGPGAMSQAHVPDEWIDVELLGQSVDVYRALALELLGEA